jgi:hypothetical protein
MGSTSGVRLPVHTFISPVMGNWPANCNFTFTTRQWLLQALNQGLEIIRVCVVWQPGDAVMMGCQIRLPAQRDCYCAAICMLSWSRELRYNQQQIRVFCAYMLTEVYWIKVFNVIIAGLCHPSDSPVLKACMFLLLEHWNRWFKFRQLSIHIYTNPGCQVVWKTKICSLMFLWPCIIV